MALALKISSSCIAQYYYKKTGLNKKTGKPGAVTLIQRFGGRLNLNLHFHTLFLDGCYRLEELDKPEKFISVPPPSKNEIEKVLKKLIAHLIKVLVINGVLINEQNELQVGDEVLEDDPFILAQASSVSYRFAFGPSKGKKAVVIKSIKTMTSKDDPFHTEIEAICKTKLTLASMCATPLARRASYRSLNSPSSRITFSAAPKKYFEVHVFQKIFYFRKFSHSIFEYDVPACNSPRACVCSQIWLVDIQWLQLY